MAEKRELVLDMLARNKMGSETAAAARDVDKVGTAADRAGSKTEEFGKKSVVAGEGAERLGKQASETERDVAKLANEIQLAERELESLARSFARTNDAAERLDISKGIRRGQNDLRRLNTSKGLLENLLPKDQEIKQAGTSFIKKLGGAISSGGNAVAGLASSKVGITIGAALGAAAAPVLVSALGSAISAGAGASVIGVGIGLAVSKDKEIQQAGQRAGKKFMTSMQESAVKNFRGPIMDSIGILDKAGERMAKSWDGAFKAVRGSVVPLTRDLVQAGETINTSLTGAASKSGPALAALGDSARLLADGVGYMIDTLSDGSEDAAGNLVLLAGVTGDVMKQTSNFLGVLNSLANNAWMTGPLLPLLRDKYQDAADSSDTLKGATAGLAEQMTDAAAAAQGELGAMTALSKELRGQADPVFGLLNASDQLAEAQKRVAASTKKHGKNSQEAKTDLRALAIAALDLQGKAGALGSTFDGKMTPAMRNTLRAAKLTDSQINQLERQFVDAKRKGDAFAKNYKAHASVTGTAKARNDLRSVRNAANDIDRAVTIAIRVTGVTNVSKARSAINKQYETRAGGGPVTRDKPYWVGEEGPELVLPRANGMVLTAAQSRRAMESGRVGGASNGGGYRSDRLVLDVTGAEGKFKEFIRHLVRTGGL